MTSMIRRNIFLQKDLREAKKEYDTRMVYALSIVMGLDPEEQIYDMLYDMKVVQQNRIKSPDGGWDEL